MNAPFRRTGHGTIETTEKTIGLLVGLCMLTAFVLTAGGWVFSKNQMISNATPHAEFVDSVAAVRRSGNDREKRIDSLRRVSAHQDSAVMQLNQQILGLLCEQNHNPRPWCTRP